MPKDTILFSGGKLPGGIMPQWEKMKAEIAQMGGEEGFNEFLTELETALEINVEKDVLSWIGDEASLVFSGVDTTKPFPFPQLTIMALATRVAHRLRLPN